MGGNKFDDDKPMMDLVDPGWLFSVSDVLTFGGKKYGLHNWKKGIKRARLFAATMRHLWKYWAGEKLDDESGMPHLAHASADIMMLFYADKEGWE